MGCSGCSDDFGGEFGIIDDLDEILWVDDDDIPQLPLLGHHRLPRSPTSRRSCGAAPILAKQPEAAVFVYQQFIPNLV